TVCPAVGDRWRPQLGVKTGADDVFLVSQPGPATRPVVRGRDLRPWRATPRAHLLWTHGPDGRPLARLPAELARAPDPHVDRLCRRSDYRRRPPPAPSRRRSVWTAVPARLARRPTPHDLAGSGAATRGRRAGLKRRSAEHGV